MGRRWDVILANTDPLPEPDPCEAPLLAALDKVGLRAASWSWRDSTRDWSQTRMVVLRATWDYPWHIDDFKRWIEDVSAQTMLLNPVRSLLWNLHKSYLCELANMGIRTVPTLVVKRGTQSSIADLVADRQWRDVVVKPAQGAGSYQTYVMRWKHYDDGCFADLVAKRDLLIQPFIATLQKVPERALVFIDGQFSHAMHKEPRFSGHEERVTGPHPVSPAELDLARSALAVAPEPTSYARVDLFIGHDGAPMVSELELLEPSLFLWAQPGSADKLAHCLRLKLARIA